MKRYEIGLFAFILVILAVMSFAYSLGPEVRYVEIPGGTTIQADTVRLKIPFPIFMPAPPARAWQDEEIGAWRVDQPISLYCFPLRED